MTETMWCRQGTRCYNRITFTVTDGSREIRTCGTHLAGAVRELGGSATVREVSGATTMQALGR